MRESRSRGVGSTLKDEFSGSSDVFYRLSRGWVLIALAVVASVIVAIVVTVSTEKQYEASALIRVYDAPATASGSSAEAFDAQQASQVLARTYATTLGSKSFLAEIAPDIEGGSLSADQLAGRVTAAPIEETGLISLAVRASSPDAARDLAAQLVTGFSAALEEDERARLDVQRAELQRQIQDLDDRIARGGAASSALVEVRAAASRQLSDLIASAAATGGTVGLAAAPVASDDPVAPRPVFNLIVALLLGTIVGVALAWLGRRLQEQGVVPTSADQSGSSTPRQLPPGGSSHDDGTRPDRFGGGRRDHPKRASRR